MACVNATGVTQVCDHAVITIKNGGGGGGNQPAFDCTGLTVVKVPASQANGNELTYEFFAAASTTNTQVTGYHWNFGDGTTKDTPATESRTKHTYAAAKPNTTATVQVKTPLGTTPVKTICSATFDVKPTNSAMAYDCVNITSSPVGTKDSLTHRFVATTSFSGTTITGYRWTFPGNVVKDTTTNTIDHTFPAKGNYEVSVAVKDASGVYKTSAACKKTFTVGPGNEQPPCVDCGGGELPKEELPNTGMEGAAAGALGTGVLGYSVHAYRRSKRALVDALRNVSVGSNDR
jgi:hypothetical protein